MNTYNVNVDGPAPDPDGPGVAAHVYSGIRSSGQYCRSDEMIWMGQLGHVLPMTSRRNPVSAMGM